MNFKKLLCMVMAMLMAVCAVAVADTEDASSDLQAQLDAANARIAELETLINDVYLPVYESQIVAEYGEDGIVWRSDAQEQYDYMASMYSSYGISISGYEDQVKQGVLESLVQQSILDDKAEELGLTELSEETQADLAEEAASMLSSYVSSYESYFADDSKTDEEVQEETIAYLESAGVTEAALLENLIANYVDEQLYNYVTADVTVSDEEIQEAYDSRVTQDEEDFTDDDFTYNSARTAGETITWNPEGYRAVKHVLIMFDDEQSSLYTDLQSTLTSLSDELEALENPEEAADEEAEASDEETEASTDAAEDAAGTAEETEAEAEPRTAEEIQADMQQVGAEIEALYTQLLPRAQEVIDAFNAGTSFDDLIAQYNEDPGMQSEPGSTIGYAVSENSTYWEEAFTDGAMSIAEVGQISAPVYGSNGIHIIYYMSDITPGAVAFEEVADAIETEALDAKISETYNNQVTAWVEEAAPVYHLDRF